MTDAGKTLDTRATIASSWQLFYQSRNSRSLAENVSETILHDIVGFLRGQGSIFPFDRLQESLFTLVEIPRSSRVRRFDAGQPSHRTRRCILLNNLRIIMIMPVMAMLRGNSSDYTVVAMITDALAFNRFTIISVAAVASGAARTKVYNYREATLWRLLLGVPLCKGLSLLQVVRNVSTRKENSRSFQ